jgi:hypothetical protein
VSDIFHEVDEEVRREQLKKLWERYGHLVIALAILVIAGIAAWRAYGWWDAKKAAESGAAFEAASTLAEGGKHTEAEQAYAKIAADGTAGYRSLARMREAAELAQSDPKTALRAYEQIAADSGAGSALGDLASLRAGAILIDAGQFEEARSKLEPLTAKDRTFRHTAREFLVVAAWRAGDISLGKPWIDMIMTDLETPSATRSRVEMLVALSPAAGKS